jgi:hypothetical protein
VQVALQLLFEKYLFQVEKERLRRGIEGQLSAAQIVFWPRLETSVRLNDEVALQLSFADGRVMPLCRADPLDYYRAQEAQIASVTTDEESLGHITCLKGQLLGPLLATQPFYLSSKPLRARGIEAWDLRKVLAEAIATLAERRRIAILAASEEDNTKKRRRRKKELENSLMVPNSRMGRDLFNLLSPKEHVSHMFKWLGVDRREWLSSTIAEIILDGSFEGKGNAPLPAEYLFVEGPGIPLWQGWLGKKRPAADIIREIARTKLEAEAYGRGLGSRRSTRKVMTESGLTDSLEDLPDLGAEALLDEVEDQLYLEWAADQLTPYERRAYDVYLEAARDDISIEEACRRRKWKAAPIRKGWQRARDHLRLILGDSDSP